MFAVLFITWITYSLGHVIYNCSVASLVLQHANSLTACRSLYVLPVQEERQRTEYLNTIAREELTIRMGFLAGAQPCADLSAMFTESALVRDLTLHHCQKSAKRTKSSVIW